jgi:hypothetical protein
VGETVSKRFQVTLDDYWADWATDESWHRGQSLSGVIEDALGAFQRELISASEDRMAEAFHGRERTRRLKVRAKAKLTKAEQEILGL